VQDHLGDAALATVGQQGSVDQGHPEAPAAENGQSHASIASMPGAMAVVPSTRAH
jgi:hypothetical protein